MSKIAYVDASAMAKLVLEEPESPAMMRWYAESDQLISSRIGVIETRRATMRHVSDPAQLEIVLASITVVEIDAAIAQGAARVGPLGLRTLDAIHLATALAAGADLSAFVTYDDRLADAARMLGLPVVRPA